MNLAAEWLAGAQQCLFGNEHHHCDRPAVVHVLIDEDTATMDCTQHSLWWVRHPHLDAHPIGPVCGLPGVTWMPSRDGQPGRCVIEGLEDLAFAELAEATA